MLLTEDEARRHIAYKVSEGVIRKQWADRMLAALDAGAEPDFEALLKAAKWPEPTGSLYHTSRVEHRDRIRSGGLVGHVPYEGFWGEKAIGQPKGVYLGSNPDVTGIWAPWSSGLGDQWDVWEVIMKGLPWEADTFNPGSYRIASCWPERLTLVGTYTR